MTFWVRENIEKYIPDYTNIYIYICIYTYALDHIYTCTADLRLKQPGKFWVRSLGKLGMDGCCTLLCSVGLGFTDTV